MKKILMVTHWFYPSEVPRGFRSYELYKKLKKEGYEVDVLSVRNKAILKNTENAEKLIQQSANNNSTSSFRKKLKKSLFFDLIFKFVLFFIGELPFVTHRNFLKKELTKDYLSEFDSVIVISLPFYSAYYTYKAIKKHKWKGGTILDMGDPFFKHQVKRAKYFEKIQENTFNAFDYITVPIKEVVPYYLDYVGKEKIKVIPQGFDLSQILIEDYKKNDVITFAYAGIFYEDIRNPIKFLSFLESIDKDFIFIIYTRKDTKIYENIIKRYEDKLEGKLIVNDLVKRAELLPLLSKVDFLINFANRSTLQTPSKLIDYAIAKRPILSVDSDAIETPELFDFFKEDYDNQLKIDMSRYDINNVCKEFIKLIEGK